MRVLLFAVTVMYLGQTFALGNYPEANTCPQSKPYYAVCTAGNHNLQGWVGPCRASRDDAQKDADAHAQKSHAGVTQWTGVTRISEATKSREGGLPP